ncbi:uncharacterized protein [Littorina saxatilis]|uniref:Uncharacterized protein n=1 Tax=Littorina saxatilis TaxID=31220 RepID=A0AAN9G5E5_9CAEN
MENSEEELTATLIFGVVNVCVDGNETTLISIKRKEGNQQVPFCQLFLAANGSCRTNDGCSCGSGSRPYSTTRQISNTTDELWTLTATLTNGITVEEDVRINEDCERKKSLVTEDSADKSVSAGSGFVNATTDQSVTTSAKLSGKTLLVSTEASENEQKENTLTELKQLMVVIAIGVPVSIFVMVLVILLVFKRSLGRRVNGQ